MAELINPANFEFFARFLLSGFILLSVRSRFVVGQRPKASDVLFESIILSLINQLVFLFFAAMAGRFLPPSWTSSITDLSGERGIFFAEVLVLPSILGIAFGMNLARGWNNALLRRLSMPLSQPVHRAHDYAFTHDRSAGLIILTYTDGIVVYGYFGEQSLAANDTNRSDIYLERLYTVDEEGQWSELNPSRSALLSLSGIRSIEFIEDNGENG